LTDSGLSGSKRKISNFLLTCKSCLRFEALQNELASLTNRLNVLETKSEEMKSWSDVVESVRSDLVRTLKSMILCRV